MTAAELITIWHVRDDLYARRRHELSEDVIETVKNWRRHEAEELAPADRATAWAQAQSWYPPRMTVR